MKIFFGEEIQGASNRDEVSNFVVKEYYEPGNAAEFIPELLGCIVD